MSKHDEPARDWARLIEHLGSQDFHTRLKAQAALCGVGQQTRTALVEGLQHPNAHVRTRCAQTLGELGDETHVQPLVHALGDTRVSVRRAVVHALFTIDPQTVEAHRAVCIAFADRSVNDTSPAVRRAAKSALAVRQRTPTTRSKNDPKILVQTARALLGLQEGEPLPHLETLNLKQLVELTGTAEHGVRREAMGVLFYRGQAVLPAVVEGMRHSNQQVRRACVDLMDHLADNMCVVPLTEALNDANVGVRRGALHSLSCDACKPAPLTLNRVTALVHCIWNDKDARLRRVATGALGGLLPEPEAETELQRIAAEHSDPVCVTRAQSALGTLEREVVLE